LLRLLLRLSLRRSRRRRSRRLSLRRSQRLSVQRMVNPRRYVRLRSQIKICWRCSRSPSPSSPSILTLLIQPFPR
jgi:hypothetical protein